jgi:hypothetical protein
MHLTPGLVDLPLLLDLLALSASAVLIGILIVNHRRYGHLIAAPPHKRMNFKSEIAAQILTQQSQQSYSRIQQTLSQEFANLQRMAGGDDKACSLADRGGPTNAGVAETGDTDYRTPRAYDKAAGMIRNGVDHHVVARRCRLSRAEINLIAYLQQKPHTPT